MLHILHGPDSFSRAEALTLLKRSLDADGMLSANTTTFEGKAAKFGELQMACEAAPFLAANRLVVADGLLSRLAGRGSGRGRRGASVALPAEWKALPELVARLPATTTLVLSDGDLPPDSPLVTALAEHGRVRNFPRLPIKALEGWIVQRARSARVLLEAEAVALLAGSVSHELGEDGQWHGLWGVANDLEKLSLYAGNRAVTADDVRRLVSAAADTNVFAWVDAVVERRGDEALRRLTDLLGAGQPAPVLLTMLVRGYRQVTLYADLAAAGSRPEEIGRRLNLPHWQLDRIGRQSARYQPPRLAAIYQRMLQADRSVKRGESDDTTALELLTAEFAGL